VLGGGWTAVQRGGLATTESVPLGVPQLLLNNLSFDLEVREFIPQALVLDPQTLTLQFTCAHLLLQQHSALDGHIEFGLQVLQGRGSVPGLSLIIIVSNFNIAQLQLQGAARVA
jgi:hypothetical protein